jgi:hypothetical protein
MPPAEVARRLDGVELSVSLKQGVCPDYIALVKNDSDEEVRVEKIALERNGLELSQPGTPKEGEAWVVAPRSGKEVTWTPAYDPVMTLQMTPTGLSSPIDIEIVVYCKVLGSRKVFRRKILVTVDYRSHRMDQLGPR